MLIRKLLNRKISPKYIHIVWAVFILALIFPISIPSKISIYNYIDVSEIKITDGIKQNNITHLATLKDNEKFLSKKKSLKTNNDKVVNHYLMELLIPDIWFTIFVINLIEIIFSYFIFNYKIEKDEIKEKRIIEILEKCKNDLKIKRKITIIKQNIIKTPAITGVFSIKLLFTNDTLELDNYHIRNIIMHELSHYKRKDNILNMVSMFLKCIHWFNPIIKKSFKCMKMDIECATDEKAVSKMDGYEKIEYCKSIIRVAGGRNLKENEVLGMANNTVKELENRIDIIAQKDKVKRYSILMLCFSIIISILIWLTFYPSSYGITETPRLYLQSENGTKVLATMIDDNNFLYNTIMLNENETIKIFTEGNKYGNYISYNQINLENGETENNIIKNKIIDLKTGNYFLKFKLEFSEKQAIEYGIYIIVK